MSMKKQVTLSIQGMHCNSCEALITDELSEVNGVSDISVHHKDGSAQLSIDPKLVTVSDVLAAVGRVGYTAAVTTNGQSHQTADKKIWPKNDHRDHAQKLLYHVSFKSRRSAPSFPWY